MSKIISINNKIIDDFYTKYNRRKSAIDVNFKRLLPEMNSMDRYSHLIHSYPAKLLPHIPYLFLNNTHFTRKGDTILDPFCGTGTVLLESVIAGKHAHGADANPLARLIANVKTKPIKEKVLFSTLQKVLVSSRRYDNYEIPEVVNVDYWFSKSSQIQLAKLLRAIQNIENQSLKDFFLVCLSNCVKKVSYADPRVSVPVKLNPDRYKKDTETWSLTKKRLMEMNKVNVFEKFSQIALENISRIKRIEEIDTTGKVISSDARILTVGVNNKVRYDANSVDLIITSPPYAGAQKYIRSSSLSLGWIDYCSEDQLKELDKKNIGRENYNVSEILKIKTGIASADRLIQEIYDANPKRAVIVGNYLNEMKDAISESFRVLKKNGYLIMIIGNNKVCDFEFNTQSYLSSFIKSLGMSIELKLIDDIKSYGLMTKRNKTADIISREYILVCKK